jgi:hypothetical protein
MEIGRWLGAVGLFCAFCFRGADERSGYLCACWASIGPGGVARLGPRSRITRGKVGFFAWNRGKYFYFSQLGGCAPGRWARVVSLRPFLTKWRLRFRSNQQRQGGRGIAEYLGTELVTHLAKTNIERDQTLPLDP